MASHINTSIPFQHKMHCSCFAFGLHTLNDRFFIAKGNIIEGIKAKK